MSKLYCQNEPLHTKEVPFVPLPLKRMRSLVMAMVEAGEGLTTKTWMTGGWMKRGGVASGTISVLPMKRRVLTGTVPLFFLLKVRGCSKGGRKPPGPGQEKLGRLMVILETQLA